MATELTELKTTGLKTDEMIINMGPQHPATHGVLRLILTLDGEFVKHTEPVIGYLHRGQEWQGQNRTWFQYQALIDRVDYLSGMFTSWALSRAAETIDGTVVPERAEWLRVCVSENEPHHFSLALVGNLSNRFGRHVRFSLLSI